MYSTKSLRIFNIADIGKNSKKQGPPLSRKALYILDESPGARTRDTWIKSLKTYVTLNLI